MDSANKVLELTIANGGGTFNTDTLEPYEAKSGYIVATWWMGTYVKVHLDNIPDDFDWAVDHVRGSGSPLFGTWVHDGWVHLDPVAHVMGKAEAMSLARDRNQIAIYDLSTGETINVS